MALEMQFTWRGFRAPSGQFASRAQDHFQETLTTLGQQLEARMRQEAPISDPANIPPDAGRAPGQLRAGLHVTVDGGGGGAQGALVLTSAAPYTGYVLRGRGPITARAGGRLRFFYRGRWVYVRSVRGVPPNAFVVRAVTAWEPTAQATLGSLVGQLGRDFFDEGG